MYCEPQILINHLFYTIPDTLVHFEGINLAFTSRRYGIIGDNGIGKTLLLKLIAGYTQPQQGSIQCRASIAYCPQSYTPHSIFETVAETLGISEKYLALANIRNGTPSESDYGVIGDDWLIKTRVQQLFIDFDCQDISLTRSFVSLSGGQQTKCLLIKSMLSSANFILWDEPTNNLDRVTRNYLYQWVEQSQTGLLVVSHDRALLNTMDEIIEITTKGIHRYGGNFDFYQEQKQIQQLALQQQLFEAQRQIKHTEQSTQQTREKHEQRRKKGTNLRRQCVFHS